MNNSLLVIGAGGHGKVVASTAEKCCQWHNIAFLDDRYSNMNHFLSWPVIGPISEAKNMLYKFQNAIIAVGNNQIRMKLFSDFLELGFKIPAIIDPDASVSTGVSIGKGVVVFSQAAINIDATIGEGSIVNTGATVDHDTTLGKGVHLSPGVNLAGEVTIGDYSWIGIGAAVINEVVIGKNVVIGAGAVVTSDIMDNTTAVGVPAKVIIKK